MNFNSIKKPNYRKIELAIENDQDFIFFGRIPLLRQICFVSIAVFLIWYFLTTIIDIINNLYIIGENYYLAAMIVSTFLVGLGIYVIIWYYFSVYRRNIIINSKKIQFRIKDKTQECLEWKDIMSISKAYYRFNKKKRIINDEKWNYIIVKPKSGEELKIYPRMLKNKDFSQKYIKEIIFYILSHYHNGV